MGQTRKVKLGMVGCGMMGQFAHLRNYLAIPECEVVALAELRPKLRKLVAERYGIPRAYASHRELLEDPEVEAVCAILPLHLTGPIGIDVLAAGKHLVTEKPMASSVEEAAEMVRLAEKNHLIHQVGFMKAYDDGVEIARKTIEEWQKSGAYGPMTFVRVHSFCGNWTHNFGDDVIRTDEPYPKADSKPRPPAWMTPDEVKAFDSFTNVYSHNLSLMRYVLGGMPTLISARRSPSGTITAVLESQGAAVILELGHMTRNRWDEEAKVYFRHGWVELLTPSPLEMNVPATVNVYRAKDEHVVVHPMADWTWSFRRAAQAFIRSVLEGTEPRTSGRLCLPEIQLAEDVFRKLRGA